MIHYMAELGRGARGTSLLRLNVINWAKQPVHITRQEIMWEQTQYKTKRAKTAIDSRLTRQQPNTRRTAAI